MVDIAEEIHAAIAESGLDKSKVLGTQMKALGSFAGLCSELGKKLEAEDRMKRFARRGTPPHTTGKELDLSYVKDIALLSREQFARFLPDLVAWFNLAKDLEGTGATPLSLIWVDDGRMGTIDSVIGEDAKTGERFPIFPTDLS